MPRSLEDIFCDYRELETLEVVGGNDSGHFGLSDDRRFLKILDSGFAKELANLPGSDTETGHVTREGFRVRGGFVVEANHYKAVVLRSVKGRR